MNISMQGWHRNENLRSVAAWICWGTFFILSLFMSCECPFDTREAENPTERQSSWVQPTTVKDVMTNLKRAIEEKNSTNYIRCFADTSREGVAFRFIADPTVATANPGIFDRWGREHEKNYFEQLLRFLPSDSTSQLVLTDFLENPLGQDSTRVRQNYRLVLHHKYDPETCPRISAGQANLTMVRSSEDLWYIYRWTDLATGERPPWSAVKASLGQ
jgi:hypothetical protein